MNKSLTDEEIILLSDGKRGKYYNMLLDRYLKIYPKLVNLVAIELKQRYIDTENFIFEFYECFERTFNNYNRSKGKFYCYFRQIFYRDVKREILKYINSTDALDHYISLDDEIGDELLLMDTVADDDSNPADICRIRNATLMLRESLNEENPKEGRINYKIIILRTAGLTYSEIAKKLKISIAQVRRFCKPKNKNDLKNIYLELK